MVEHLLWAARGGNADEVGNWFTGRERALAEVVSWLGAREPGLCVITGPAGCGKSAVAGRIVSLSNPEERAAIVRSQGAPADELDPRECAVGAHVQLRGATLERCAELLADQLGVIGGGADPNHHDLLSWARNAQGHPVIVLDGLDEAGDEGFRIATSLVAPLSGYALVILASREVSARVEADPSVAADGGRTTRAAHRPRGRPDGDR